MTPFEELIVAIDRAAGVAPNAEALATAMTEAEITVVSTQRLRALQDTAQRAVVALKGIIDRARGGLSMDDEIDLELVKLGAIVSHDELHKMLTALVIPADA